MSTLTEAIKSLHLQSATSAEVLAALGAPVIAHQDSTPQTYGKCARQYGARVAEAIGDAMDSIGMKRAAILYVTEGIDLSLDDSQEGLSQIADDFPALAEVCEQLKALGRVTAPQWQAVGLDALPSLEDIEAALSAIANEPPIVWDDRRILVSINTSEASEVISVNASQAATVEGRQVIGDVVDSFVFNGRQTLTAQRQALVDAIRAAVQAYRETL